MIYEIESIDDPRVRCFASLTDNQLRLRLDMDRAMFIAESPKVITTALDSGFEPVAILCERRHLDGDAAQIVKRCEDVDVFTGTREVLSGLTGYTLTRGVLCAMCRPDKLSVSQVVEGAHRVVVLDGVSDTTNIGAIFRSAAALGVDGILLTRQSCDPFNRRAIRVSMGSVFRIPWTYCDDPVGELRSQDFTIIAMALRDDALSLDDPALLSIDRLALIMGTEGDGLSQTVIDSADMTVRIPMAHGIDSLNVAAATAVAVYTLRRR